MVKKHMFRIYDIIVHILSVPVGLCTFEKISKIINEPFRVAKHQAEDYVYHTRWRHEVPETPKGSSLRLSKTHIITCADNDNYFCCCVGLFRLAIDEEGKDFTIREI